MRKRRYLFTSSTSPVDINLSPLIDIVFILLIFFIVTAVFVEETGVEIDKPQAVSSANLNKQSILVAITQEGKIFYGGRDIGVSGVRPIVMRLLRREKQPVIIQADRSVPTHLLVRVVDEAKRAGAISVNVSTEWN